MTVYLLLGHGACIKLSSYFIKACIVRSYAIIISSTCVVQDNTNIQELYIWSRVCMAPIPVDSVPVENRFVAIRFKQPTDSCLIWLLIIAVFRFLKILVDSIRFDSKRFYFFRFRTGSVPYVQRFRFLNRFGTILKSSTAGVSDASSKAGQVPWGRDHQ